MICSLIVGEEVVVMDYELRVIVEKVAITTQEVVNDYQQGMGRQMARSSVLCVQRCRLKSTKSR